MNTGDIQFGVTLQWTSIPPRGGGAILSVASCYRNQVKLWLVWETLAREQLYLYVGGGGGGKEKRGQEVQERQKKVSTESRNLKVAGSGRNRKKITPHYIFILSNRKA